MNGDYMSKEVDEAIGEAPEKEPTVFEKLDAKRAEFVEAQRELARANQTFDTDAVVRVQERIRVLQGFISTLEVDAELLIEEDARKDASKRVLGVRKAIGSLTNELTEDES